MDRPDASPAELEAALQSLRGLNRYFGSYRIVARFMKRWIRRGERVRVLDLATGSADIPRQVADHARAIGATAEIVAVDFQATTIGIARRLSAEYPEIRCECADVLAFAPDEPFDIVICSLALHHFSDEDAVRLLRRAPGAFAAVRFGFGFAAWALAHVGRRAADGFDLSRSDDAERRTRFGGGGV